MKRFRRALFRRAENILSGSLAKLAGLRSRRRSPEIPRNVLLVKSCCLGDAVLSLYAIREFKKKYPNCRLEALVSSRIEAVYHASPDIDQVHAMPITGFHLGREILHPRFWIQAARLAFRLHRKQFDMLIDLELYRNYGVTLTRALGIPFSRGFEVEGAPVKAHDQVVSRGRDEPEWQCFYKAFGLLSPPPLPMPLFPSAKPPTRNPTQPRVGLVFGASANWPQKRWPLEHFATLGRELQKRKIDLMLFGSTEEKSDADLLMVELPKAHNTVGQLEFSALVEALSRCDMVIGNDTGTLHVAAAAGIPVLSLFGPTSPQKWNPLTSRALFLGGLNCRPCYYLGDMPDCKHRDCLRLLRPERVLQVALEGLDSSYPTAIWAGENPIPLAVASPNIELGKD